MWPVWILRRRIAPNICADVAPRTTLGSGSPINVADWVQVGRYVLGLDPPTPVGGPDHDPPLLDALRRAAPPAPKTATARALTIDAAMLTCKKAGVVWLTLNALGGESAIGCTIHFDAKRLKFVSAQVVGAATAGTLLVNDRGTAEGDVGLAFMLPLPHTCKSGKQPVIECTFLPLAAGKTALTFGNQVVFSKLADTHADELPVHFVNGTVLVQP